MGDYSSPDGRKVGVVSNMGVLFSDGFGGTALDLTRWDVFQGGLGANPTLNGATLTQGAIGTGVTGMTYSVASSILSVVMGTTNASELWFLSKGSFAGSEDITVILNRPAVLAANSVWMGLVEVDPATEIPLLNPNLAQDFTNRGGVDFMKQGSNQAALILEAVEDSSGVLATTGAVAVNAPAAAVSFETVIEYHAEDLIASTSTVDSAVGRSSTVARLSSQVPNDGRKYKFLMRFKNLSAPGSSSTINVLRVVVVAGQEMRVEISSGRGDAVPQKGVPVNIANPLPVAGSHKLFSAASTNATSVKASSGFLMGGTVSNVNAAARYFKLYNKASAPTVGTDVPIFTLMLPAGSATVPSIVNLADLFGEAGHLFGAGIAYAITGAAADSDTTAISANDCIVNLNYL